MAEEEFFRFTGGHPRLKNWVHIEVKQPHRSSRILIGDNLTAEGIARAILSFIDNDHFPIKTSIEFADRNCESHYCPLILKFTNQPIVTVEYENYIFLFSKKTIEDGCKAFLEAQYMGMGV